MKKSNCKTGIQTKKLNNKGMTLIELIVAIAILVLAAIPLVYGFISSAKYNAKSRIKHQTTAVAQTIIEDFKASPYQLMVDNAKAAAPSLASISFANLNFDEATGVFVLNDAMYEGIPYDCRITVTPRSNETSIGEVVKFNDVADGRDAVYTANKNMDAMAYEGILRKICDYWETKDGDVHVPADVMTDCVTILKRQIEFDITQTGGTSGPVKASVEVFYYYKVTDHPYIKADGSTGYFDIDDTTNGGGYDKYEYALDGSETPTPMVIFNNDGVTYSDGNDHFLEKLIIYYYPAYKRAPSGVANVIDTEADEIIIKNTSSHGVEAYIYKQKNPYLSEARLSNCEVVYTPTVNITNSSDKLMDDNFGDNISDYAAGAHVTGATYTGSGTRKTGTADTKKTVQFMYDIKVEVYGRDAYSSGSLSGTPLTTMTATLVE